MFRFFRDLFFSTYPLIVFSHFCGERLGPKGGRGAKHLNVVKFEHLKFDN